MVSALRSTRSVIAIALLVVGVFLFFINTQFVHAQTATTSATEQNMLNQRALLEQQMRDKRAAMEQEMKDRRAAMELEMKNRSAAIASSTVGKRVDMQGKMIDQTRAMKERMGSTTQDGARADLQKRMEIERETMRQRMGSSTEAHLNSIRQRFELEQKKMQTLMQQRREEIRSRLGKQAQEQYEKVLKRLSATVLRLDDIADRLDSRITKLSDNGITTTTAKSLLTTARSAIANADTKIKTIPAPVFPSSADASTTPDMINNSLKPTRDAALKAQDALRAAQTALMAVVKEIKLRGGVKANEDENSSATGDSSVGGDSN